MAVFLSVPATRPEEAAGLAVHLHLVIQVSQDLGGHQRLFYDHDYREWAAAKSIRVWEEINLSIYGRCLSHPPTPSAGNVMVPVCIK